MNAHKYIGHIVWKGFVVLLLLVLALQNSGVNSLAAPAAQPQLFQRGDTLSCGAPKYPDVQVVLMIDDSGSMRSNDPKFQRNKDAKQLVNLLASQYYLPALLDQAKYDTPRLPNVNVAVIHFGKNVLGSSDWKKIDLNSDWNTQLFDAIDQNREFNYRLEQTDFRPAFEKVKELWNSPLLKGASEPTRRSIIIYTDGTPEDSKGRFTDQRLDEYFNQLQLAGEQLPKLDGIYIVGYKVDRNYFTQQAFDQWNNKIVGKSSGSNVKIPITVLQGSDTKTQFEENLKAIQEASSSIPTVGANRALERYATLDLQLASGLSTVPQGVNSDINFKLVDTSGKQVLPGDDPKYKLALQSVSVIQGISPDRLLDLKQDGGNYLVSWKPETTEAGQFKVSAQVVDANNSTVLDCTGDFVLPVVPEKIDTVTNTAGTSLVIMPPREPLDKNKKIILPLRLNYDGEIKSVKWNLPHAQIIPAEGQPATDQDRLTAKVETVAGNVREANLVVDPVGKNGLVEAGVGALITVVSQDKDIEIQIPDGTGRITIGQPVCAYSNDWNIWFWPLLIGLVGLMILLLALRAGSRRDTVEDPRANRDIFRIRDWHVLFWPLVALLILLILVPVLKWTCILPPWLFLVSLLFWLVMAGLLRFIPGHNIPRSRAWALMIALLALVFLGFLTIALPALSWLTWLWLVIALAAILVVVWYISRYEPLVAPPVQFNLEIGATSQLPNGKMLVSMHVLYDEQDGGRHVSEWAVKKWHVLATPPGRDLSEQVMPDDNDPRKGSLLLSAMEKDIKSISIQVRADVEADGRLLSTPQATATILRIDIPEPPDDLTELEGIEEGVERLLHAHNIYTFKQLAEINDWHIIDGWLKEKPWGKMMDPKTWPQQAKLADIAKRYEDPADQQNYKAYKSWLKDGIEPDEHNNPEKPRRTVALLWNGIPQFTPVILSVPLTPSDMHHREAITLPMQLDHDAKETWLSDVEWKVSAKAMPGGTDVETTLQTVDADHGSYELVIAPVQIDDKKPVEEIQVTVQALVNGRSIGIYDEAVAVQVSAPPAPDNLEELEGIGPAVQKVLNQHKVFTFKQLANTESKEISTWLNAAGLKMMDPKTWPQQARLADVARKYGREEDLQSYQAYKSWLKNGIEPDEVKKDEKDRRPVALP